MSIWQCHDAMFKALTSQRLERFNFVFSKWGPRVMGQALRAEESQETFFFFFLSGFPFTDTDSSQSSRGREGTFVYSTLLLLPAHDYSDLYLQLCLWDGNHVFLITTLVYQTATQWDLPPYWITIWLIDWWCDVCLFNWWFDCRFFVMAVWHGKPMALNSHRLSPLYYKPTD